MRSAGRHADARDRVLGGGARRGGRTISRAAYPEVLARSLEGAHTQSARKDLARAERGSDSYLRGGMR